MSERRRLFLAMIVEEDDAKRAELRRQYVEMLNADAASTRRGGHEDGVPGER